MRRTFGTAAIAAAALHCGGGGAQAAPNSPYVYGAADYPSFFNPPQTTSFSPFQPVNPFQSSAYSTSYLGPPMAVNPPQDVSPSYYVPPQTRRHTPPRSPYANSPFTSGVQTFDGRPARIVENAPNQNREYQRWPPLPTSPQYDALTQRGPPTRYPQSSQPSTMPSSSSSSEPGPRRRPAQPSPASSSSYRPAPRPVLPAAAPSSTASYAPSSSPSRPSPAQQTASYEASRRSRPATPTSRPVTAAVSPAAVPAETQGTSQSIVREVDRDPSHQSAFTTVAESAPSRPSTPSPQTANYEAPPRPSRPAPQTANYEAPSTPSRPAPQTANYVAPSRPSRPAPQTANYVAPSRPSPAPQNANYEAPSRPSRPAPQTANYEAPSRPSSPAPQAASDANPTAPVSPVRSETAVSPSAPSSSAGDGPVTSGEEISTEDWLARLAEADALGLIPIKPGMGDVSYTTNGEVVESAPSPSSEESAPSFEEQQEGVPPADTENISNGGPSAIPTGRGGAAPSSAYVYQPAEVEELELEVEGPAGTNVVEPAANVNEYDNEREEHEDVDENIVDEYVVDEAANDVGNDVVNGRGQGDVGSAGESPQVSADAEADVSPDDDMAWLERLQEADRLGLIPIRPSADEHQEQPVTEVEVVDQTADGAAAQETEETEEKGDAEIYHQEIVTEDESEAAQAAHEDSTLVETAPDAAHEDDTMVDEASASDADTGDYVSPGVDVWPDAGDTSEEEESLEDELSETEDLYDLLDEGGDLFWSGIEDDDELADDSNMSEDVDEAPEADDSETAETPEVVDGHVTDVSDTNIFETPEAIHVPEVAEEPNNPKDQDAYRPLGVIPDDVLNPSEQLEFVEDSEYDDPNVASGILFPVEEGRNKPHEDYASFRLIPSEKVPAGVHYYCYAFRTEDILERCGEVGTNLTAAAVYIPMTTEYGTEHIPEWYEAIAELKKRVPHIQVIGIVYDIPNWEKIVQVFLKHRPIFDGVMLEWIADGSCIDLVPEPPVGILTLITEKTNGRVYYYHRDQDATLCDTIAKDYINLPGHEKSWNIPKYLLPVFSCMGKNAGECYKAFTHDDYMDVHCDHHAQRYMFNPHADTGARLIHLFNQTCGGPPPHDIYGAV